MPGVKICATTRQSSDHYEALFVKDKLLVFALHKLLSSDDTKLISVNGLIVPKLVQTVKISILPTLYSDDTNFFAVNGSRLTLVNRSEVGTNG